MLEIRGPFLGVNDDDHHDGSGQLGASLHMTRHFAHMHPHFKPLLKCKDLIQHGSCQEAVGRVSISWQTGGFYPTETT